MIRKPTGTIDFFPEETKKLRYVEDVARRCAKKFGFGEIRTPTIEATELFARGVGSTTDVVQKEMYTFVDRDGPSITLRPEGTAGVARAIIENGKYGDAMPLKYYYIINCFRHERPQAGRFREFSQFGVELFGSKSALADATIIALANEIIGELQIPETTLHINSIGCPDCRPAYHGKLKEYFASRKDELCDTCKSRLEQNPMRILDCKSPVCKAIAKDAPKSVDHLCDDCRSHMDVLEASLSAMGIGYEIDTSIVRGLDYYTRTVFEFICGSIGAQSTICGGGRYDGLMEEIGGSPLPACGFGMGITRLLPAAVIPEIDDAPVLYIAPLGAKAQIYAMEVAEKLRAAGVAADCDIVGRSLKAQMKYANKIGAHYTLMVGDSEIESGKANLKNMKESSQEEIELSKIVEYFVK
jgi:histidyl-tRNA synthetase